MFNRNYRPNSSYYVSRNTSLDEILQAEAEDAREREEMEENYSRSAWEKQFRIAWEVSGHSISIELRARNVMECDYYFRVEIDGQKQSYQLEDIKSYSNAARPEIVARLGKAGLTQERKDALVAMWDLRSEWFSPIF